MLLCQNKLLSLKNVLKLLLLSLPWLPTLPVSSLRAPPCYFSDISPGHFLLHSPGSINPALVALPGLKLLPFSIPLAPLQNSCTDALQWWHVPGHNAYQLPLRSLSSSTPALMHCSGGPSLATTPTSYLYACSAPVLLHWSTAVVALPWPERLPVNAWKFYNLKNYSI